MKHGSRGGTKNDDSFFFNKLKAYLIFLHFFDQTKQSVCR